MSNGTVLGIVFGGLSGIFIGFIMCLVSVLGLTKGIPLTRINYKTKIYRHTNKIVRQKRYKVIGCAESNKYLVLSILGILIGIGMFIGGIMGIVYAVRTYNMQSVEVASQLKLLLWN